MRSRPDQSTSPIRRSRRRRRDVARVPAVAQRVRLCALAGVRRSTVQQFLADRVSRVRRTPTSSTSSVTNHDPTLARKLVGCVRRGVHDLSAAAGHGVGETRADECRPPHAGSSFERATASRRCTRASSSVSSSSPRWRRCPRRTRSVVQQADRSAQVQPKPTRNGILGLALGIILGIGLAFLWEALDTRVRAPRRSGTRRSGGRRARCVLGALCAEAGVGAQAGRQSQVIRVRHRVGLPLRA